MFLIAGFNYNPAIIGNRPVTHGRCRRCCRSRIRSPWSMQDQSCSTNRAWRSAWGMVEKAARKPHTHMGQCYGYANQSMVMVMVVVWFPGYGNPIHGMVVVWNVLWLLPNDVSQTYEDRIPTLNHRPLDQSTNVVPYVEVLSLQCPGTSRPLSHLALLWRKPLVFPMQGRSVRRNLRPREINGHFWRFPEIGVPLVIIHF